jgi:ABC-2 type transport system permease protein
MRRIALIFWQTYWGAVTQRTFVIFVLGLPFLAVLCAVAMGVAGVLFLAASVPPTDTRPIGVVDGTQSIVWGDGPTVLVEEVVLRPYADRETAAEALASGELQAYFVLPAEVWEEGRITAVYDPATPPSPTLLNALDRWLTRQVRRAIDPILLERLAAEPVFVPHGVSVTAEGEPAEELLQPPRTRQQEVDAWLLFFAIIYLGRMASMLTSGYMYDIIASESRNRTMEILLTSTSPREFMLGRVAGLLMVGFTHLVAWGGVPLLLIATSPFAELGNWEHIGLMASMLLGAYLLDQMLGATGGVLRVTGGAGPQLFNLLGWFSILTLVYAGTLVGRDPNSGLAVAASLFPFSSPIVLLTRLLYEPVPLWQIVLAQLLLWLTIAGFILLLARLLRRNLVAYPARFSLWRWVRGAAASNG